MAAKNKKPRPTAKRIAELEAEVLAGKNRETVLRGETNTMTNRLARAESVLFGMGGKFDPDTGVYSAFRPSPDAPARMQVTMNGATIVITSKDSNPVV